MPLILLNYAVFNVSAHVCIHVCMHMRVQSIHIHTWESSVSRPVVCEETNPVSTSAPPVASSMSSTLFDNAGPSTPSFLDSSALLTGRLHAPSLLCLSSCPTLSERVSWAAADCGRWLRNKAGIYVQGHNQTELCMGWHLINNMHTWYLLGCNSPTVTLHERV